MTFVFKYITETLIQKRSSLQCCLDDKTWARPIYEENIRTRKEYAHRVEEIDRILKLIKYKPKES